MELSLKEAATRLGKTPRQVRYLIRQGKLAAQKVAGRWILKDRDLPWSAEREQRFAARQQELRAAVDEALQPQLGRSPAYSVRSVRAFQHAVQACQAARLCPVPLDTSQLLEDCVRSIARGAHAYHRREKAQAWPIGSG